MPSCPAIEALIVAFYAAFDNRCRRVPDGKALRGMFIHDARITRVTHRAVATWTPEEFIAPRISMLTNGTLRDFHEWETAATTTISDHSASRCSTFSKAGAMNGLPYEGVGRKFIHMIRSDDRWAISSILWEEHEQQGG